VHYTSRRCQPACWRYSIRAMKSWFPTHST
jgi:hypothetical protein